MRPQFSACVHDFRTEQRARSGAFAGYENYVDRYELNGGLDAGYSAGKETYLVVGQRYGPRQQGELLGVKSSYSSDYSRIAVGIEGAPARWLSLNLMAGPDVRRFSKGPAGLYRDELLWFADSSMSWLPTGKDTVTAMHTRFEQPAFSSHSVHEDIVYDVTWRRQHSKRVSGAAGFRIHAGDWQAPVNREDWIYTPSPSINCVINRRLTAGVSYSCDRMTSAVPNTRGREFKRHLFWVGARGSF